jgi:hypothetical protein
MTTTFEQDCQTFIETLQAKCGDEPLDESFLGVLNSSLEVFRPRYKLVLAKGNTKRGMYANHYFNKIYREENEGATYKQACEAWKALSKEEVNEWKEKVKEYNEQQPEQEVKAPKEKKPRALSSYLYFKKLNKGRPPAEVTDEWNEFTDEQKEEYKKQSIAAFEAEQAAKATE